MPRVIGKITTVLEIDGLSIRELVGNAATSDDALSVAIVNYSKPATEEPWMTNDYDEWLNVKSGKIVLEFQNVDGGSSMIEANAGETLFVGKGDRVRFSFPEAGTEYFPICSPAFRPDRSHRELGGTVAEEPVELREVKMAGEDSNNLQCTTPSGSDIIYHMCQKVLWEEAVKSQKAYYPPTFEKDGFFTHATAVPGRLIETANHFYTTSKGEWICLQLSKSALTDIGIITKYEGPLPVGDTGGMDSKLICPHIYGGIPTLSRLGVLTKTYRMIRNEDGHFLYIEGLTEH